MKQVSVTEDFLKQALQAHTAMRDWIKAVPDDIQLPAMPGVDGDWLDDVQGALTTALEKPPQEPDAASTITQIANNYGRRVGNLWHFDDLALSIFTAKVRGLNAPTPSPVQEPSDEQIALLDPWMRPAAAKELLTQVLALKTASKTS